MAISKLVGALFQCLQASSWTWVKMNELSPRKYPRSPNVTPPRWKKPQDVMKHRKIRLKENALMARINKSPSQENRFPSFKRKNPFRNLEESERGPEEKRFKNEVESIGEFSLLQILGSDSAYSQVELRPSVDGPQLSHQLPQEDVPEENFSSDCLPLDWTLRTKMRFISKKPFPWSLTLKTCEEASGITGFVRCLDWKTSEPRLDTSPNGRFHQSCLVWVQPYLPWMEVFPRHNLRRTGKPSFIHSESRAKEALQREWANSFRSLFQLVRARHCPYFYMVANSFTCLFKAAGINTCSETTACITPTTRGFRKLLTDEGVCFKQPLKVEKGEKRRSTGLDGEEENATESGEEEVEEEDKTEEDDWLASLNEAGICTIRDTQELMPVKKEDKEDGIDESLVRVDGCDAQALFNFLINCKSVVSSTGPLAGIPPTLLAPVAFPGGTLAPLKVHESSVKQDDESYYSIEVRGPILPNTVINLCTILQESVDTFSATLANVESTKALTLVPQGISDCTSPIKQRQAFSEGSLADSGLDSKLLPLFCSVNLKTYDSIKYSQGYQIL